MAKIVISRSRRKASTQQTIEEENGIGKDQVHNFEMLDAQLKSAYGDIQTFVKKNPKDAINKFQLALVNSLIKRANDFFNNSNIALPLSGFSEFLEEDLPIYGDVLIVISQYLACMDKFRSDNIYEDDYSSDWYWKTKGTEKGIRTAPPRKIENK